MKILFIDTHSSKVNLIIKTDKEEFRAELDSNRSHSEVVVPALDRLLKKSKIKLEEIDELIVVNGPGSFTGVRIGVTIAKTIAVSLNIPIKTITSLEMFGVSSNEQSGRVIVEDSKGVYSARILNNKYDDFKYQKKSEFEESVKLENIKVLKSDIIDIDKIIKYLENKECVNPHLVNPIYIKEIDALK